MTARLHSLEEIDTHRSGFADAARLVLVNANGKVGQMGALADFIEVEPRYERAVEACLGDLLQHVLVERLEHVSAGLELIRQEDAGRCGFVVGRPDGSTEVHTEVPTEVRTEVPHGRFFTVVRRGSSRGFDGASACRVRRRFRPALWRCRRWCASAVRSPMPSRP